MKLLPAIDLIDGRCVRLTQGDFARECRYPVDPAQALRQFAASGAVEAHLVDLDGARAGEPRQHDLFLRLAEASPLTLQVAGGFRTPAQVERMLAGGIGRVVIGSLVLTDPATFLAMLSEFGADRIVLALDVRLVDGWPFVATHGWQKLSSRTLDQVLGQFPSLIHLLVTDIARDGALTGPNVELMQSIADRYPGIQLQASGGVAALGDLASLRTTGATRAIVGKAIWEERFTVAEGIVHARG